jgi:hypothetical protein
VKRPILGLLAAAMLTISLAGSTPAWAALPQPTAATGATPAHHHDHHDGYGHHRDGGHHHDDGDGDDEGGHRRRCRGLVVVCLL